MRRNDDLLKARAKHRFYAQNVFRKAIPYTFKSQEALKIGIPALVKYSGYSYRHLYRLFKNHTDKSLLEILTENRMTAAESMLTKTDFSLLDIADELGYESPSRFMSVFKSYYGLPPHKYRMTHRSAAFTKK
ncbi:hypothetical protein FACS1894211_00110 [Clostridia bacterium]|nr:hypothetical protein FACS1894211_00110 [Clostridia bacterium]